MSDNQATQNRECLWCETPIEGRTDKQFCSSACKARHNRDNPKNEPAERYLPAVATRPAVSATSIRYVEPVEEDEAETEDENWEVAYEREQQAKRDKEEASRLHRIYAQQATQFLKQEGLTYSWRSLDDSGEELDEAADKYRQHPGLPDPDQLQRLQRSTTKSSLNPGKKDRKSTRLNSSHRNTSRMPSSA